MIYLIGGVSHDIPEEFIATFRSRGMVAVAGGTIRTEDMERADQAAQPSYVSLYDNQIELDRRRLYFELDNGEQHEYPIGLTSSRLESLWEFSVGSRRWLVKNLNFLAQD